MTDAQANLISSSQKALAAYKKKVMSSPAAAKDALVKAGSHTKTGRLTRRAK